MGLTIHDYISIAKNYRRVYSKYPLVIARQIPKLRKSRIRDDIYIKVTLKDGRSFQLPFGLVNCYASFTSLQNSIKNENIKNIDIDRNLLFFQFGGKPVYLDPSRFSDPYCVFLHEEYKFLKVEGKDVIDVGMNVGDSTIYFALKGARRVIGLEPFPYAFSYAEKNIELNNIENCILLNAGYGEDGETSVESKKISSISSSTSHLKQPNNNGKKIKIYSLRSIIELYEIEKCVVKMDCEGCEYSLINEPDSVFDHIEMMQIEYHYGIQNLVNKLESVGFTVKFTQPQKSYNPASKSTAETGYIYAEKQQ